MSSELKNMYFVKRIISNFYCCFILFRINGKTNYACMHDKHKKQNFGIKLCHKIYGWILLV